ncbi:MAG: histidine kinase [Gemmatimonadetes bacterium]|nr:histidine kinase [Gemmatimonadota bacterium]
MDDEASEVKERLRDTLTRFTDSYAEPRIDFDYAVLVHHENRVQQILATPDVFGLDEFRGLEHYIEGQFDESGVFRGRVVAFAQDLGIKEVVPKRLPTRSTLDRLGPFRLCIGTFEQELINTTHSNEQLEYLKAQALKFGGITVYRDGLRVMPYGRHDADFFGIEEQRGKHQGRYFWAHRRSFGRVAFTHGENPNLRDKAGREGLVENRAKRHLRALVKQVLIEVSARYFGSDSDIRKEMLPEIQARNAAARLAAEKAKTRRRRNLRQFLKEHRQPLSTALAEARTLADQVKILQGTRDRDRATIVIALYRTLTVTKEGLRPPPVPTKLGDLEDRYREYRDDYREFVAGLDELGKLAAAIEAEVGSVAPAEAARRSFRSHQSVLNSRVDGYFKKIESGVEALLGAWRERAEEDRGRYYKICHPLLDGELLAPNLGRVLNVLEFHRRELEEGFAAQYQPVARALEQLVEGIDIDGALAVVEDDMSGLEDRVRDLNAIAQVGITVEIIGHELESLDAEVRRNLLRLPEEVRRSSAFKLAFQAQGALTDRLRFLSPLKIAGYRARETITGAEIASYIADFFERTFADNRIEFSASDAFRSFSILDLPSRIFPVFINLVNNAVYWVSQGIERQVKLDFVDGKVVVADSGSGVDPDDVPRLFELFFTRRRDGRGVGLYLSQVNLAVAHHRIRYGTDSDPRILSGANFIIEFKDVGTNG